MVGDNRITGVIFYRDEVDKIPEAVQSLAFVDHLFVLEDVKSQKSMRELCQQRGYEYQQFPISRNFSDARNYALSQVETEWVLFLDADEVISASLQREIQNAVTCQRYAALRLRREDVFLGKTLRHGEAAAVRLIRCARRTAGYWVGAVHEHWHVAGEIVELQNAIQHHSHVSVEELVDTVNAYSTKVAGAKKTNMLDVFIELILYPPAKFVQNMVLRGGWKDGMPGLILAWSMSLHSLLVRVKQLEKEHV